MSVWPGVAAVILEADYQIKGLRDSKLIPGHPGKTGRADQAACNYLRRCSRGTWRIFPFNSKVIDKVEVTRSNHNRRAKLFYLRVLKGKAARLREVDHRAEAAKAKEAAQQS